MDEAYQGMGACGLRGACRRQGYGHKTLSSVDCPGREQHGFGGGAAAGGLGKERPRQPCCLTMFVLTVKARMLYCNKLFCYTRQGASWLWNMSLKNFPR